MKAEILAEGHHGQSLWCRRRAFHLKGGKIGVAHQTLANIVVREDQAAAAAQILVAAGVVSVIVGVNEEFGLLTTDRFDCSEDLVSQGRILIVDEKGAVRANQQADITTLAGKHIYLPSDRQSADGHFFRCCAAGERRETDHQNRQGGRLFADHGLSPLFSVEF